MTSAPKSTGARRFYDVAEALCRAVGNAIRPGFIQAAMAMAVVRRIQRVRGILLALEARFLAGLVLRSGRAVGSQDLSARVRGGGPSAEGASMLRLPTGFAWLCRFVPGDAASYAGQLRVVLAEPGMVALLASCPQAVRAVQPLCRMLGIARADYVPGERVATAIAAPVAPAAVAPWPVASSTVPTLAEAMAGMAWTRFIPG